MGTLDALKKVQRCMVDEASMLSDEQLHLLLDEATTEAHRYMGGTTKTELHMLAVLKSRALAGDTRWQLSMLADVFVFWIEGHMSLYLPEGGKQR